MGLLLLLLCQMEQRREAEELLLPLHGIVAHLGLRKRSGRAVFQAQLA